jgi:hypothetical protein
VACWRAKAHMERDEVWRTIDAHRVSLADLLEQLPDDEWRGRRCALAGGFESLPIWPWRRSACGR